MARWSLLLFLSILVVPASAKPHSDKQPISCSDLWSAVTATLGNSGDYKILGVDDEAMKSNFIVVGGLFPAVNLVQLKPRKEGCDLHLRMGFTGADDDGAFRSRVSRALKKLNAAKVGAHTALGQAQ